MSYFFQTPTPTGPPQTYSRDRWMTHTGAVATLQGAGIPAPDGWVDLLARFTALAELGDRAADQLAHELIHPSGRDITSLRAAALAEEIGDNGADAAVTQRVQALVHGQLQALYEPVSKSNYKLAASRFDAAAKRFAAYAHAVDVEADGEALVTLNAAAREGWLEAPGAAAELEAALRPLFAAAALAGAPDDIAFIGGATDIVTTEFQIAIATDPGKAHRRRVWEAWHHKGGRSRTGRWGALLAHGVTIRAASDPSGAGAYSRPEEFIPVSSAGGRIQNHDPHDGPIPRGFKQVASGWMGESGSDDGNVA